MTKVTRALALPYVLAFGYSNDCFDSQGRFFRTILHKDPLKTELTLDQTALVSLLDKLAKLQFPLIQLLHQSRTAARDDDFAHDFVKG